MARPQVAVGGTASSIEGSCEYIEKQLRRAEKEWSFNLGIGKVLTTPHRKKESC